MEPLCIVVVPPCCQMYTCAVSRNVRLLLIAIALALVSPAALGQNSPVQIRLDQFGLGRSFRPGDFTAIRVELTNALAEPTPVVVQVEVANADGDIGEFGRSLTLTPGATQPLWLYVPLPTDFEAGSPLPVRVFEERDGRRRRELGGIRISPGDIGAALVPQTKSMIAVVADAQVQMGLNDYSSFGQEDRPIFAHEDTRVVFGIRPEELPDHWEGLRGFEAIAWGKPHSPRDLGEGQVRALRRYIERGGHLIITLPDAGNPWGLGAAEQSPFFDLLLEQAPEKQVDVPLSVVQPVLTKAKYLPQDIPLTVHVFKDLAGSFDVISGTPFRPLIALNDGRVIAVQRSFGFGHITIVGLDLANRTLLSMRRALQADVFWNPILGRRVDTPTPEELRQIKDVDRLSTAAAQENSLGGGALFSQLISMSEQAGRGMLAVLLLFVLYWLVAGPVGFFVLKQYRLERHAWVAFAAAAGVFTAAAWGMVSIIKPQSYRIRHVTVLDLLDRSQIDPGSTDPPLSRALSWFSLNMPGYRRTSVFIDSEPDQRDLLASWSPPDLLTQPFPNPDRYRVDVSTTPASESNYLTRNQGLPEFRRPSRATATQFYADWMGSLSADWGGTIRSDRNDPVQVLVDAARNEQLTGSLIHDLPGELTDVSIIWIHNRRLPPRQYEPSGDAQRPWVLRRHSGQMLSTGDMWRIPDWAPGARLVLREQTQNHSADLQTAIEERYIKAYTGKTFGLANAPGGVRPQDRTPYLEMLGLFNQLEPPSYLLDEPGRRLPETVAFYRLLGRPLDLSSWFTSPCLIVTGQLRGVATPIPVLVNEETPENDDNSLTLVRWIYPLPVEEQIAFSAVVDTIDADESAKRNSKALQNAGK